MSLGKLPCRDTAVCIVHLHKFLGILGDMLVSPLAAPMPLNIQPIANGVVVQRVAPKLQALGAQLQKDSSKDVACPDRQRFWTLP